MKTNDPKKKYTKASAGTKKATVKKTSVGKAVKSAVSKAAKTGRKPVAAASSKTAKTPKKTLSKTAAGKKTKAPAAKIAKQVTSGTPRETVKTLAKKKTAVTVKKPAAAKAKKPAAKTVKAKTKALPKKTVTAKAVVKVKAKPKARVSKVSAVKPKPATKSKKIVVAKKTVTAKAVVKVKAKPKARVSKVSAIKPAPAAKSEKKTAVGKVKIELKPKAVVRKVAALKPAVAEKKENKTAKKMTTTVKTKIEAQVKTEVKPRAAISKISAMKPKPLAKAGKKISGKGAVAGKESPVPASSSLRRGVAGTQEVKKAAAVREAEPIPARRSKARLKIFLPNHDLSREEAEIFFGGLPEEYGENSITALVVDPNTIFVDWEVIPKDIADKEGDLNLRFYDITGIEFNDWNAHSVIDVLINKRVGNGFFDIRMPGRDVVVAVGLLNAASGFMPIVRSEMVSFPELLTFDELGIVQKLFESGIPVGY